MFATNPAARRGVDLTEFLILVVLVAVAVIAGLLVFSPEVQDRYTDAEWNLPSE